MAPRKVTRENLTAATRAALGSDRKVKGVARLAGGTTKGVYRLTVDDDSTVIAYLWADSENYWPQAPNENDAADPFSPGNSIDLFLTARSRLASLGLRVPEIYLLDRDRAYYPADIAILEDFPGEDLLALWERDPAAAVPTLARLRARLAGSVGVGDMGGCRSSEEAVLALGLLCVAEAVRDHRIANNRERLKDRLHD